MAKMFVSHLWIRYIRQAVQAEKYREDRLAGGEGAGPGMRERQCLEWTGATYRGQAEIPAALPTAASPARLTIADDFRIYLTMREGTGVAAATLRKHRTFTKQLGAFAEGRGYVVLDQFTSADIDISYANWKLGARTKGHALGLLRSFFRFCVNREWLAKSPVTSDLEPPLGANRVANKVLFTDEELNRILGACDQLEPVFWSNGRERGIWIGADTKDFIWLLVYTGLRISHASFFDTGRLRGNEVFLRAKKNGGDVFTWIPDWLRDRLEELQRERGARPFIVGESNRLETVTDLWRRKINRVLNRWQVRNTTNATSLHHPFARILLQPGVSVADVADLLGDDEETIRQHYVRWVPERQARLTNILQHAFNDKPKPKIIALTRQLG